MRRSLIFGISAVALMGLGLFGLNLVAEEVRTRVTLTSQPAGATVIVDGQDRGMTPLSVFDLSEGRHHVKYRLAGYVERNRFITIDKSAGANVEKNEVLVEEKGLLLLKSVPAGCAITIDGVRCGETPQLITHLTTKDAHTVRFSKRGYRDSTAEVKFKGRTPLVVEERLSAIVVKPAPAREKPAEAQVREPEQDNAAEEKKEETCGRIELRTDPAGATVVFDGKEIGVTKAGAAVGFSEMFTIEDVPEGEHTLVLKCEGYHECSRKPRIQKGKTAHGNIRLERIFVPDVEVVSNRGSYRGVLVSSDEFDVTIEVSPGITRSFPRSEIRRMTKLSADK